MSYRGIKPTLTFESELHPLRRVQFQWHDKESGSSFALFAGKGMAIYHNDDGVTFNLTYLDMEHPDAFASSAAANFVHFGQKWQSRLGWFPEFLSRIIESDPQHERIRLSTIARNEEMFSTIPFLGANRSVFTYQVIETEQECKMRLHFYGAVRVLLTF